METTRQDFIVGLLIVVAIAIVVGARIATSGLAERRYDLYMRVASAEGITADTRITPRVDPTTGALSFLARLSIAESFQDGSRLLTGVKPLPEPTLAPPDSPRP